MSSEWQITTFDRMAQIIRDTVQPSEANGFPYVGLEHIGEGTLTLSGIGRSVDAISLKSRFKKGDILFGKLRPYFRKIVRAPFDGICSTDIWVVRPKPGVDVGYLFYLMASTAFIEPVVRTSEGTKMPRARWDYASKLEFPIPPLAEQRAIAHILGTLDDKIELNRRMSHTLEEMARALFKAWFVDFEPVRAKMQGRWRRGESLPGLPAHLYDLFPDRLVDSQLGMIPEGWEVETLGEFSINFDSKRIPLSSRERETRHGTYPYFGATGVLDYINDYIFNGVYVLVGEDGSVMTESGHAVTQYVWGKFWVNNHAHILQGKRGVSTEQLYLYFHFESVAPYITGAVQPKLSQGRMNTMPFIFAGEKICRIFAEIVSLLYVKLRTITEESRTLAALRDALLPELIRGELRVKDAEKFLKERELC